MQEKYPNPIELLDISDEYYNEIIQAVEKEKAVTLEEVDKEIAYIRRQITEGNVGTPNVHARLAELERIRSDLLRSINK